MIGVIGDNTIDRYVGEVERTFVGGNALNVAVQLHRHGRPVHYSGAVADDPDGQVVRAAVEAQGVGVTGLRTDPGETAVTLVEVAADGERSFAREDFGVTARFVPAEAELDLLARCDWVHLGMTAAAQQVRDALRARGPVRLSQDCAVSPGHDGLEVAFLSVGDDRSRAPAAAREALAGGARLAVATCGAAGAYATDGQREWWQDATAADVVDTTGAGDSFIAGFIAARVDGHDVPTALRTGSQWAAATCGHLAGWPQDPS
ncbi:PfkB family carbohydrate kinase [Kineococcus aurantiacus]|uniref:Fructoselysine 6-kinase n=1 Tax=Kineococcus aurantiacus TaxID=37633 RepID=A0A7Y9DMI1_9ACTN|nr:fructoselysine 6-kinase [Kineococcus aurantiacus]